MRWSRNGRGSWNRFTPPFGAANESAAKMFPPWDSACGKIGRRRWNSKTPRSLAGWKWTSTKFAGPLPKDARLRWPGRRNFPCRCRWSVRCKVRFFLKPARPAATRRSRRINNIIFRLLATTPPGKLSFTIFDPVGLGQNFAALMHLADYEERQHQQPHLDAAGAVRGKARGVERAHGENHPDVSAQRIRDHRGIQRPGRQRRGEISFPRHRVVPGEFQRHRRASGCATSPPTARAAACSRSSNGISATPCRRILCRTNCAKTASAWCARKMVLSLSNWRVGRRAAAARPAAAAGIRHGISASRRREAARIPTASRCRLSRSRRRNGNLEGGNHRGIARAHRPFRRDEIAISRNRQRHAPARAHRGQDRFRQIHFVPRHHHQPRAAVQPGAGGILSRGFQKRRRVQVLRAAANCRTRESSPSRATANLA